MNADTQPIIECRELTAGYGPVQVLFGVDLRLDPGERVVIFGRNGVGKSTLLRTLSGLLPVTSGTIRNNGRDITGVSTSERTRSGIAMVVGGDAAFGSLTVAENLRMHGFLLPAATVRTRVEEVLETLPALRERLHQPAAALSGGERQMLGLAKAVIARPQLLLCDELSMGLAPAVVGELSALTRRLSAEHGMALLVVEQSVPVGLDLADRFYVMSRGRISAEFSAAQIHARPSLLDRALRETPPDSLERDQ